MQITTATPSGAPMCPQPLPEPARHHGLFPPRDADEDTYRRWIASSPLA